MKKLLISLLLLNSVFNANAVNTKKLLYGAATGVCATATLASAGITGYGTGYGDGMFRMMPLVALLEPKVIHDVINLQSRWLDCKKQVLVTFGILTFFLGYLTKSFYDDYKKCDASPNHA